MLQFGVPSSLFSFVINFLASYSQFIIGVKWFPQVENDVLKLAQSNNKLLECKPCGCHTVDLTKTKNLSCCLFLFLFLILILFPKNLMISLGLATKENAIIGRSLTLSESVYIFSPCSDLPPTLEHRSHMASLQNEAGISDFRILPL